MINPFIIEEAKESDLPQIKTLLVELIEAMTNREGFDIEQSYLIFEARNPVVQVFRHLR